MAFSLSFGNKRNVNLIFNDHSIRYLELKSVHPPIPLKWGEHFLPPGVISDGKITDYETLSTILDECIEEWKIQRRQVNFIVPDPLVIIRKIAIPIDIQEDEVKSHLYMELGSSIHLPFEDPVFDVYPLGEKDGKKELLLFASPEKFVMDFANLLSSLKLQPAAADISPLALYRIYYMMDKAHRAENLFTAHINLTSVSMCIFEGHIPYFMRHFPLDFNVAKWDVRRGRSDECEYVFKGDPAELEEQFLSIYSEMGKLMDFYRYSVSGGTKGVTKILLDGDHPMLNKIHKELGEQFGLPIVTFPSETVQNGRNRILPPGHTLALGLALKEVE
ncbi:type IV pilus biogenesis protein PilM [Neobacillus sp. SCS-31]|uniref:type IV pilus biogenesis protein PilM n=1 Tax=Neobacillus oceani TaxID=3115292 RepID=UPI003905B263